MSDAPIDNRRAELASRLLVALLAGLFLLGLLGFVVAVLDADEDEGVPAPPSLPVSSLPAEAGSSSGTLVIQEPPRILVAMADPAADATPPTLEPAAPDPTLDPAAPDPTDPTDPTDPDDPSAAEPADAEGAADPAAAGAADLTAASVAQVMPVVPVARFWSDRDGLARRDIVRALENGELPGFRRIVVEDSIREALAETLGLDIHPEVQGGDAEAVSRVIRTRRPRPPGSRRPGALDASAGGRRPLAGGQRPRPLGRGLAAHGDPASGPRVEAGTSRAPGCWSPAATPSPTAASTTPSCAAARAWTTPSTAAPPASRDTAAATRSSTTTSCRATS